MSQLFLKIKSGILFLLTHHMCIFSLNTSSDSAIHVHECTPNKMTWSKCIVLALVAFRKMN